MRITILVSELPPHAIGGTETQSLGMAHRISENNEVTILTRKVGNLAMNDSVGNLTIKRFLHINLPIISFIFHVFFSLFEIGKMRRNIDILQCMMTRPNGFIGFLAKKLFGIRYIVWLRGEYMHYGRGKFPASLMVNLALSNANMILTQTKTIREEVVADYPHKNIEVVSNGVEVNDTIASGNYVIFVGNLIERKGVHNLINALKELDNNGFRVKTIIVGDGYLRPSLERLAYGLDIKFVGRVLPKDVKKYLKKARVLVLPSVVGKGEGLPNVILEAMSLGIPVIASNIAGIPDVVVDGKTGFLFNPGDSSRLARQIIKIIQDDELHYNMSKNCKKVVKKYSWGSIIKDLEQIYQRVVTQ